ncbi:MAG: hypothetical protein ACRECT_06600 [Thermoplasmata archaeon]
MRGVGLVPVLLLAAGAAFVVLSVIEGHAGLAIVVVLPVVYGGSLEFGLGVLLLVAGLLTLPFVSSTRFVVEDESGSETAVSGGSGGVVLLGPVPIFLGGWRGVPARTRWILAGVGGAVLVLAVLAWLWLGA